MRNLGCQGTWQPPFRPYSEAKLTLFSSLATKKLLNFCKKHAFICIFAEWKQNILLKNSFFAPSVVHRASKQAARRASDAPQMGQKKNFSRGCFVSIQQKYK